MLGTRWQDALHHGTAPRHRTTALHHGRRPSHGCRCGSCLTRTLTLYGAALPPHQVISLLNKEYGHLFGEPVWKLYDVDEAAYRSKVPEPLDLKTLVEQTKTGGQGLAWASPLPVLPLLWSGGMHRVDAEGGHRCGKRPRGTGE